MTIYKTIPNLPAASAATALDEVEVSQSGTSRRLTVGQLAAVIAPSSSVDVSDFGAVGDGVTDDRAAIQAAIDYVAGRGGGDVSVSGGKYLIDSGNLVVRKGVTLRGPWLAMGVGTDWNFLGVQSQIILNPLYSIVIGEIYAALYGLLIVCKGMVTPTTLRQGLDAVALYSGKAVIVGDPAMVTHGLGNDCWISNCFIAGFNQAIWLWWCSRYRFEYIYGDCTNGIYTTQCFDLGRTTHCHFYPFLTGSFAVATYAVSNAVNNGSGLIRLTTAPHVLTTGDIVTVIGTGGVPNALGRWTVTVINGTTIDLVGSTFAGAYTSGGTVFLSPFRRQGTAYFLDASTDWGEMEDCFSYGYDIGTKVMDSHYTRLDNVGHDNYAPAFDQSTIGIWIAGTSIAATLMGCRTASQGYNLRIDSGAVAANNHVLVTNHVSWASTLYSLHVVRGSVSFTNMHVGTNTVIRVETGANAMNFFGGVVDTGVTFSYASATARAPSFRGTRGIPSAPDNIVVLSGPGSQIARRIEFQSTTPTANDTIFEEARLTNNANALTLAVRTNYRLNVVTAGAESGDVYWTIVAAGVNTLAGRMTAAFFAPSTAGSMTLGQAASGWGGLYMAGIAISALPAAASSSGARFFVTDSNANTYGAIVAAGGSTRVPVYSDGTNWRIG